MSNINIIKIIHNIFTLG